MKILCCILFTLFVFTNSIAQELVALPFEKVKKTKFANEKSGVLTDTVSLPFIDDFSISKLVADSTLFISNGGTFVNNNFCVNPPSYNVITFDGLNENGSPYNETNPFDRGLCDNLTSQAINLKDSTDVFMSFWWQAQGNAVLHVADDSIQLSFLDTSNTWNVVWVQNGQLLNNFQQEIIEISEQYIHSGFQFKFENFGNRTGMFGVWHIDYIYIDANRSVADTTLNDMAFSTTPSSYLEKYWAMPTWQFFENPLKEIATTTTSTFNNFKYNSLLFPYLIDTQADEIDIDNGDSNNIQQATNVSVPVSAKQVAVSGSNTNFLTSSNGDITIKNKFLINSNDQNIGDIVNGKVVQYATTQNDTISSFTKLTDYYAYDDGSAEQAFRITTQDAIVLQEFELNREDTLYGVAIYFPGNPYRYDSTQLILMVWNKAAGEYNVDDILYTETVLIGVTDSLNGFTYYNLLEPVIVSDSFYIGYKQDTDDDILIGFDVNSSPLEPIYFNKSGTWQKFIGPGVLMIRPLMKRHFFTSINKNNSIDEIKIYPNPASNEIYFSSEINEIQLFDIAGKLIYSEVGNINKIDLTQFENGIYFLNLWHSEKNIQREKLIIAK